MNSVAFVQLDPSMLHTSFSLLLQVGMEFVKWVLQSTSHNTPTIEKVKLQHLVMVVVNT